jgi:hypothetical protein
MSDTKEGPILGRGFVYDVQIVDDRGCVLREDVGHNLIPQVGVDHIANLILGTASPIASWFVGLYEGNYAPTSATKASDLPGSAQESTAYSQTARRPWNGVYDDVQLITSVQSKAEFTFNTAKRIYGAFLISEDAKGGSTGTLLSIARFANPYDVQANSTFRLGVSLTLLPAS